VAFQVGHQLVIGGVELDLVAAVAGGVEELERGRITVGDGAEFKHGRRAQFSAALVQPAVGPGRIFAGHRLAQGDVVGVQVGVAERRHLVGDLVGR